MRLINADDIPYAVNIDHPSGEFDYAYRCEIDALPTVDAVCDGCPVYYEMLNEIQCLRDKCRRYEQTIYKLSVAITERAEMELHDTAS